MCPICIISAIVLGASAASAGGVNWLTAKLRGKQGSGFGSECQLFPQSELTTEAEATNAARHSTGGTAVAQV
jgi:hypothetical protein